LEKETNKGFKKNLLGKKNKKKPIKLLKKLIDAILIVYRL
jgi:hypothetical protein